MSNKRHLHSVPPAPEALTEERKSQIIAEALNNIPNGPPQFTIVQARITGTPTYMALAYQMLNGQPWLVLRTGNIVLPDVLVETIRQQIALSGEQLIGAFDTVEDQAPLLALPGGGSQNLILSRQVISPTGAIGHFLNVLGYKVWGAQTDPTDQESWKYIWRRAGMPEPELEEVHQSGQPVKGGYHAALLEVLDIAVAPPQARRGAIVIARP